MTIEYIYIGLNFTSIRGRNADIMEHKILREFCGIDMT